MWNGEAKLLNIAITSYLGNKNIYHHLIMLRNGTEELAC